MTKAYTIDSDSILKWFEIIWKSTPEGHTGRCHSICCLSTPSDALWYWRSPSLIFNFFHINWVLTLESAFNARYILEDSSGTIVRGMGVNDRWTADEQPVNCPWTAVNEGKWRTPTVCVSYALSCPADEHSAFMRLCIHLQFT